MKKMIRANSEKQNIFSEPFKDDLVMTLGRSNPDWDKFFKTELQPFCNEVLEDMGIWCDLELYRRPMKTVFYDMNTDEIISTENFRPYSTEITDIYLDSKTSGPGKFKQQLRTYFSNMFKEVE